MADEGFIFTGSAVAFGARLDVPDLRDVRGSITLPSLGGTAALQLGPTEDKEGGDLLYRFRSASSSVTGEGYDYPRNRGKREYETRVACSVERLELWDVVRADLISATLVSTFVEHHRFHEETVTLRGLRVNGMDRAVERRTPQGLNNDCTTVKELVASARAKGHVVDDHRLLLNDAKTGEPSEHAGKLALMSGRVVCYLFEPSYITFMRGRIKYEIFLGEYVIDQDLRRLTMLRMEARDPSNDKAGGKGRDDVHKKSGRRSGDDDDKEGSVTVVQPLVNGHRPP